MLTYSYWHKWQRKTQEYSLTPHQPLAATGPLAWVPGKFKCSDVDACTMIVESTIGTVGTTGVREVTFGEVDDVEVDGIEDETAARLRALSSWFRR